MRTDSLATRLGLKVGLMSVALVALIAAVGALMLHQGLERIAQSSASTKMEGIAHSLATAINVGDISSKTHVLVDLAMGHNNLYVSIFDSAQSTQPVLTLGSKSITFELHRFPAEKVLGFHEWLDPLGRPMLSASQLMRLKDGTEVGVYLTIDQSADAALLDALLKWALIASPFLLLLTMTVAWWTVRRGLRPLTSFLRVASKVSTDNLEHRLPMEKLPAELRELANGINFMLHRLDNGVQQLSQFSDDLAHELRAPITNLMGKVQVTLSRERPPQEYREVLESCSEELDRVTRIVSDMLFLAHVSHPASQVQFDTVALDDELQRVGDLFSLSGEEKGVHLEYCGGGLVRGNRLMIQRAISNLLSNAIRYCPSGACVQMRIDQKGGLVRLSVGNPGHGIGAEHLPHLFERFYRVDKSRARSEGGTGLGLAIVRSIMSLHQGNARVEVDADGYTRFYLEFPAVAA
ncbi:heavy metal sensor histidine kinase [Pseudomonas sp. GD03721]|nr:MULTISPECIES: heavy metal sensor histidine kinase [unclassified Pseudomonas]MDG0898667.1 heavy metal sensor histidine kinase [Pseudomonas sp. L01]MDH1442851.1 heavy metal sensor histidine kinase [Pseudomonas sp. GD03722]WGG02101.1 heavy metal sensor histidine kinase [Pseudomonas sp. GD03721]WGG06270.1 heavy metal sensor histidine kinase [Pseudomonas sp. GD03919]